MMTDDEIIAVVQAHKEGKKIECRSIDRTNPHMNGTVSDWKQCKPYWNFDLFEYRVTPEPRRPREWMCMLNPDGTITPYDKPVSPEFLLASKTIRVREVIE
jgi:hypothetical protein